MDLRGAGARDRRMREARGLASESLGADTVNVSFSRRMTPYENWAIKGHVAIRLRKPLFSVWFR
jgi:hypothetical protein